MKISYKNEPTKTKDGKQYYQVPKGASNYFFQRVLSPQSYPPCDYLEDFILTEEGFREVIYYALPEDWMRAMLAHSEDYRSQVIESFVELYKKEEKRSDQERKAIAAQFQQQIEYLQEQNATMQATIERLRAELHANKRKQDFEQIVQHKAQQQPKSTPTPTKGDIVTIAAEGNSVLEQMGSKEIFAPEPFKIKLTHEAPYNQLIPQGKIAEAQRYLDEHRYLFNTAQNATSALGLAVYQEGAGVMTRVGWTGTATVKDKDARAAIEIALEEAAARKFAHSKAYSVVLDSVNFDVEGSPERGQFLTIKTVEGVEIAKRIWRKVFGKHIQFI